MHSRLAAVSFMIFLPFTNNMAFAEEFLAKSLVTNVTVFPSGAQIVRSAKIELIDGDQTIVLQGLPERLIDSSLRVEGTGGQSFEIGSVDTKRLYVNVTDAGGALDKSERKQLELTIEQLTDESNLLTSRINAAQTQRRLMEHLTDLPGQSPAGSFAKGGGGANSGLLSVDNWGKIFDLIGTRMNIADDLISKYRKEQREITKDIAKLKKRLAEQPPKKERQMEVRVNIHASAKMTGRLKIKYQVREASWRPFYDARLATGLKASKPVLSLTRRAGIRQWSGEDWSNVKLSLSTTSPQKGSQAPVLRPRRLDLFANIPLAAAKPAVGYLSGRARSMARTEAMPEAEDALNAPAAPLVQLKKRRLRTAVETSARVKQYAFQAVFEIPGLISILPTGDEKKVAISSDKMTPEIKIKAVPKLNSTAFIYAKFTHDKKATPLLPGSVALYRDGTFSGNGFMPLINAGDEYALGFGADEAVKVVRSEVKRTKGEAGVFTSSKTDEQRYVIKVTNLHQNPVNVEIIDQIPYSVNEQVVVQLLSSSTKPSHKNLKDKRGILAWNFSLKAGAEKKIKLNYSVTWPADKRLRR